MPRIADKYGLTNQYRENGSKRLVKRGRPKTKFLSKKRVHNKKEQQMQNITPKQYTLASILLILVVLLFVMAIIKPYITEKESLQLSLEQLHEPNHPMVFDSYEQFLEYYQNYNNFSVKHPGETSSSENVLLEIFKTNVFKNIRSITFNFRTLPEEEKAEVTLEKVLDIVISYIPAEFVLEHFEFDKAIQVEREGYTSYELYYRKTAATLMGNEVDKIDNQHGFSVVVKEYDDGTYIAGIGDQWFENVYNQDPIIGPSVSKEELASHCEWNFSLAEVEPINDTD